MTVFDLKSYLKEKKEIVDLALDKSLPREDAFPVKIYESMRYSLSAGGKRVRPILCMAAHEICGGRALDVLPVACALEMIHTFSLIHDDLPAMDDDNLRRGVPTNHRVFGEAIAILAGDGLHAQAFEILGELANSAFDLKSVIQVIAAISRATGASGMVGGQVLDIEAEGKQLSSDQLATLHHLKTGALITVSVVSGAKLATNDFQKIEAIRAYGDAVGLAFQVADDILDIEGGENIGKDVGSDLENHKMTYVTLLGLEGAKKEAQRLKNKAIDSLASFGDEALPLRALAAYIVDRKN